MEYFLVTITIQPSIHSKSLLIAYEVLLWVKYDTTDMLVNVQHDFHNILDHMDHI